MGGVGGWAGTGLSALVVGVSAGLLLLTLARVEYWLYFLSLLATVRGGTSFLGPSATKKRSKENASPQSVLSVPSVQTTAFGSRVARCSQKHGYLKPSFSRILTSPRFATSGLGQVPTPADSYSSTRVCGKVKAMQCFVKLKPRSLLLTNPYIPRFATSALGQVLTPTAWCGFTRIFRRVKSYAVLRDAKTTNPPSRESLHPNTSPRVLSGKFQRLQTGTASPVFAIERKAMQCFVMLKSRTLLLANPYIPTLRHQCSGKFQRPQTGTASPVFAVA